MEAAITGLEGEPRADLDQARACGRGDLAVQGGLQIRRGRGELADGFVRSILSCYQHSSVAGAVPHDAALVAKTVINEPLAGGTRAGPR